MKKRGASGAKIEEKGNNQFRNRVIGKHTIETGIPPTSSTTNRMNPRGEIQVDRILQKLSALDKTILGFMGVYLEGRRSRPSRRRTNLFIVTIVEGERPGFQGTPNHLSGNNVGSEFFLWGKNPKGEIIIRVSREPRKLRNNELI